MIVASTGCPRIYSVFTNPRAPWIPFKRARAGKHLIDFTNPSVPDDTEQSLFPNHRCMQDKHQLLEAQSWRHCWRCSLKERKMAYHCPVCAFHRHKNQMVDCFVLITFSNNHQSFSFIHATFVFCLNILGGNNSHNIQACPLRPLDFQTETTHPKGTNVRRNSLTPVPCATFRGQSGAGGASQADALCIEWSGTWDCWGGRVATLKTLHERMTWCLFPGQIPRKMSQSSSHEAMTPIRSIWWELQKIPVHLIYVWMRSKKVRLTESLRKFLWHHQSTHKTRQCRRRRRSWLHTNQLLKWVFPNILRSLARRVLMLSLVPWTNLENSVPDSVMRVLLFSLFNLHFLLRSVFPPETQGDWEQTSSTKFFAYLK